MTHSPQLRRPSDDQHLGEEAARHNSALSHHMSRASDRGSRFQSKTQRLRQLRVQP